MGFGFGVRSGVFGVGFVGAFVGVGVGQPPDTSLGGIIFSYATLYGLFTMLLPKPDIFLPRFFCIFLY